MAGFIPEHIITEIKNTVDIVDIVSEAVLLKKNGNNYVGLCPFHAEKTPSFTVSSQKQIFHCFGCGEGGNVFTFLMKHDGLSFPEAAGRLAGRCGIEIPRRNLTAKQKRMLDEKQHLLKINQKAAQFFQEALHDQRLGQEARGYLKERGYTDEIIHDFGLGFAPQRWDYLIGRLNQARISPGLAVKAGLIVARKNAAGFYDRFRGRIIFPIIDASRQVLGFGGRVLNADMPKYLNTPETAVYHKKRALYGVHRAKGPCREKAEALIVEGYLDLLALHQHGIAHSAATLGTALTTEHIHLLKGFVGGQGRVILVFDSDAAGIKAAQRSIPLFEKNFTHVSICVLPPGHDPDSFIMEYGADAFKSVVSKAKQAVSFLMDMAIQQHGLSVEGKIRVLSDLLEPLSLVRDKIVRGLYIKEFAEKIGIDETAVLEKIKERQNQQASYARKGKAHQTAGREHPEEKLSTGDALFAKNNRLERQLITMMIQYPRILPAIESHKVLELFADQDLQAIGKVVLTHCRDDRCDVATLMGLVENERRRKIISLLTFQQEQWDEAGCLGLIRQYQRSRNQSKQDLLAKIKAAENNDDDDLLTELLEKMQQMAAKQL